MATVPDVKLTFADAEAKLFRNSVRFNNGTKETLCDRVIVQHFRGPLDDVVIYEEDGEKRVGDIRLSMNLRTGSAAITTPSWRNLAEPLDSDDENRLLLVYDKLMKISAQD